MFPVDDEQNNTFCSDPSSSSNYSKSGMSPASPKAKKICLMDPNDQTPPYTLFCGNLHRNTTAHHIRAFFDSQGIFLSNVRLIKTRNMERRFCFVDLPSFDQMRSALKLNGTEVAMFGNQAITINRSNYQQSKPIHRRAKTKAPLPPSRPKPEEERKTTSPKTDLDSEKKNSANEKGESPKNKNKVEGDGVSTPQKKKRRRGRRNRDKNLNIRTVTTTTAGLIKSIHDAKLLAGMEKNRLGNHSRFESPKLYSEVLGLNGAPLPATPEMAGSFNKAAPATTLTKKHTKILEKASEKNYEVTKNWSAAVTEEEDNFINAASPATSSGSVVLGLSSSAKKRRKRKQKRCTNKMLGLPKNRLDLYRAPMSTNSEVYIRDEHKLGSVADSAAYDGYPVFSNGRKDWDLRMLRDKRSADHKDLFYAEDSPEPYMHSSSLPGMKQADWQLSSSPTNTGVPHSRGLMPPNNGPPMEQRYLHLEEPAMKNWIPEDSPDNIYAPWMEQKDYRPDQAEVQEHADYGADPSLDVYQVIHQQRVNLLEAMMQLEQVPDILAPTSKTLLYDILLQNDELQNALNLKIM